MDSVIMVPDSSPRLIVPHVRLHLCPSHEFEGLGKDKTTAPADNQVAPTTAIAYSGDTRESRRNWAQERYQRRLGGILGTCLGYSREPQFTDTNLKRIV